ncbi:WAT1-related protein At4g08290-like [Phoenix dactylifera]|uniref:WAT1-related protein n=1 Tax=Phoenix dactylifera TaxID=42345 RepID=A0A8B7CLK2_PHODC|nr:WAT1-related protein At4g08290-like [Phoenix dactylifera]
MAGSGLGSAVEAAAPYLVMTLRQLALSVLLVILQSVLDPSLGVSAVVMVVYQQLVSLLLLCSLALLFDRGKRPKPSSQILSWAFFIGFLQIPVGELMFTASLRYITATFQSVAMNLIPAVVFVLAVACRQERFRSCSARGQAKLWGVLVSTAGATFVVVSSSRDDDPSAGSGEGHFVGSLMVGLAVLGVAFANLFVERVAVKYPADLTLAAIMNLFGTLQTLIVAALIERNPSSWRIKLAGSLQLLAILYGGTVVTGLSYLALNWCVRKKGPVFATAFSPLLVIFSFLIQTLVLGVAAKHESFIGSVLVVGGLYLLLWAKSKDHKIERMDVGGQSHLLEDSSAEPML